MNGVSYEWIEAREDEIARMITATERVDDFRILIRKLRDNGLITPAVYAAYLEQLDHIANALHTGKRNTATLRNRSEP